VDHRPHHDCVVSQADDAPERAPRALWAIGSRGPHIPPRKMSPAKRGASPATSRGYRSCWSRTPENRPRGYNASGSSNNARDRSNNRPEPDCPEPRSLGGPSLGVLFQKPQLGLSGILTREMGRPMFEAQPQRIRANHLEVFSPRRSLCIRCHLLLPCPASFWYSCFHDLHE
jgi:hypothetical protein